MLRIPHGMKGGESKDCISTAVERHFRPVTGGEDGRFAPLGKAGGHDDYHTIGPGKLPGALKMPCVTMVEGVVFSYHTKYAHGSS